MEIDLITLMITILITIYLGELMARRCQVKLRLTPKAMKIIDRRGIDAVVTDMLARGEKI